MKKLTNDEQRKAFNIWLAAYGGNDDMKILGPFLDDHIKAFIPGNSGWLRRNRTGLFLSAESVAASLKISRAAYSKYEHSEEKGSITLATLVNAAEAMDCELVYAIRPKCRKYFSQIIWEKLLPQALLHPWIEKCDQRRRAHGLAYVVKNLMTSSQFRREQGWSQRARR